MSLQLLYEFTAAVSRMPSDKAIRESFPGESAEFLAGAKEVLVVIAYMAQAALRGQRV